VRILLTAGLVLAWSMPAGRRGAGLGLMTNTDNGVLNYALTNPTSATTPNTTGTRAQILAALTDDLAGRLGCHPVRRRDRLRGALAGLARARGGGRDRRRPGLGACSKDVTFPIVKPIFLILTSLLDHLDFGRLHPAVPADRPDAHQRLERTDGHLPVRGGLREDRTSAGGPPSRS